MAGLAPRDLRCDPAPTELATMAVVVVAAVGAEALGSPSWSADLAAHSRHAVDERDQLGAVVTVAARDGPGERDSGRVDEEVVLGAVSSSSNRDWAGLGAPSFACTRLASATARDYSISPAVRKRATSSSCSRSQPPACCHSSRRCQQVTPDPKPSSAGRCVHEIPCAARTRRPATPAGPTAASDPGSGTAAPSFATAARPAPTTHPSRSTAQRPSAPRPA